MHTLQSAFRLALTLLAFAVSSAAHAQDAPTAPDDPAWQAVITGQVEAFRHGDATAAFGYAGAQFQTAFPNAMAFYATIVSSGYAPIALSRSHSFGPFQMAGEQGVAQIVRFVGPNQDLFEALYQLRLEPDGWRVEGVALTRRPGIGV